MSADNKADVLCCASCGTADGDDIKLKRCNACYLVRYCSVKCQREHRPQHKKECKRRAAELRDEILFKQPDGSCYGDCPICCLPLPIDREKCGLSSCCCKLICQGCNFANQKREFEGRLEHKCPFCRKTLPKRQEENVVLLMERIEVNDPVAMCQMGRKRYSEGDYQAAFEYYTKAAALGDAEAHFQLSTLYREGKGVEKDEKREQYHAEEAAIGGHINARHNLGCYEWKSDRMERAAKHWIIAAKLGFDDSLECAKDLYKSGYVSKEDLDAALLGHRAAIAATKSPQREEAYVIFSAVLAD